MDQEECCRELERRLSALPGREERLAAAVAVLGEAFGVRPDEVAIFLHCRVLDQPVLRFLWPQHLAASPSGYVPMSSANSLAVRTFIENSPFINLLFSSTPHASYFEMLPVEKGKQRPPPIQKIISAPLRTPGGFQGVVQISHKGENAAAVAADFREEDLTLLAALANILSQRL
jgi:GAF domain-containing protein